MKLEFDFQGVSFKLNPNSDTHAFFSICTIIGGKIVDKLSSNGITSENKNIHSPVFKVGVFVIFYR